MANENDEKLNAARRWFKEAQYGLMVHWGLYALLGGEWRGRVMPGIAEWAQAYFRIPNAEYAALAKAFDPIFFNADEWVQIARDAGMKYVVFTSKHHDGFAMFRSKVSRFNVVDATPFGRDVVGELAEACRKHGLRLGLYYSQDLDWSHPDGGGYTRPDDWCGSSAWTNNWDFPDKAKKDFARYFEEKAKPQVEEILTQYGDLALVWRQAPARTPQSGGHRPAADRSRPGFRRRVLLFARRCPRRRSRRPRDLHHRRRHDVPPDDLPCRPGLCDPHPYGHRTGRRLLP